VAGTDARDDGTVDFELIDRSGRLAAVRLAQEIGLAGPLDLTRTRGAWRLRLPRPDVDRMEYLFELEDHNGNRTTIPDPGNPHRAGGAFGDKSVLEFPGYQAPAWLATDPVPGDDLTLEIESTGLAATIAATVWTPATLDPADPAPLLVVHDGPEYAALGGLVHYVGSSIASGALPPVRAALLGPGDRNAWYSAAPGYARALSEDVLPALEACAPATVRIGVGVSLGALAMLHAHRADPRGFDGLLLQSGSFFTPDLDPQEAAFSGFAAVTGFVGEVHAAAADPKPVPTVITCGTTEENLANNEAMAATLRRLGYPTEFARVRDSHNYTAWRDALDPHLTALVTEVVCARAA
jgi:enterochelin esterase-like enzyme